MIQRYYVANIKADKIYLIDVKHKINDNDSQILKNIVIERYCIEMTYKNRGNYYFIDLNKSLNFLGYKSIKNFKLLNFNYNYSIINRYQLSIPYI